MVYNFSLFIILPIIRYTAELQEHNYSANISLIGTTYNNLGAINLLLFHPAGDAYHVVHHLYPAIPWWKQKEAHHFLMKNDANYRNNVLLQKFKLGVN